MMRGRWTSAALYMVFFLSGFSALAYELVWTRLLVNVFGVTYPAIATTVTVFMAGLALGAAAAGRLIDRARAPLKVYAALELALAVMGLCVPPAVPLVQDAFVALHLAVDPGLGGRTMIQLGLCAVLLLPPTTAMGATLPVLARQMVRDRHEVGAGVGRLYGINALGATLGCFLAGFILISEWGLKEASWLAVVLNLVAGGVALACARLETDGGSAAPPRPVPPSPAPATSGSRWWLLAFFLAGGAAMSAELLLTRIGALMYYNPHTLVFALVLSCWLAGLGMGGLLAPRLLRRVPPHRAYGGVLLLAGLLLLVAPILRRAIWGGNMPTSGNVLGLLNLSFWPADFVWLVGVTLGAAALFGAAFPLASVLRFRGMPVLGSAVGEVVFATTAGGIAGSFITGFWLMPAISAKDAMLLMGATSAVVGAVAFARPGPGKRLATALALIALLACLGGALALSAILPEHEYLSRDLHREGVVYYRDGRSTSDAVVQLKRFGPKGKPVAPRTALVPNGELPLWGVDMAIHLPLFLHPNPRRMLLIAFATGYNSRLALRDPALEQLTCCDLSDNQWLVSHMFRHEVADLPPIQGANLKENPRFLFMVNDGRNHLLIEPSAQDIIFNDAAYFAAYSQMFTREFLSLARERLNPGGLYVTKLHLDFVTPHALGRLLRTFLEVFPQASLWTIRPKHPELLLLIGRKGPRVMTVARLTQQLRLRGAARAFPGLDACALLRRFHLAGPALRSAAGQAPLIEDLYPMRLSDMFVRHPRLLETRTGRGNSEHPITSHPPDPPDPWILGGSAALVDCERTPEPSTP